MNKDKYLIRILDDDEEFLDAIGFLLKTEGWRASCFSSVEQFLHDFDDAPGCVILDVRMPSLSGPEVQERLKADGVSVPVVFLTGHGDLDLAVHVFRAGAWDFLQKPVTKTDLLAAIERAVDEDDRRRKLALRNSPVGRWDLLTEREKVILRDVALFLPNRLIAEKRGISERTVECHRASGMKKLGLHKPAEVADLLKEIF